nr:glycosyltransferase family 2 protein [Tamaricihabitans halophyticus]
MRTVPVLAILVCHDGAPWLGGVLSALRRLAVRPRHVLAVDNGSSDHTGTLLADAVADGTLAGVHELERDTGFADAVATGVAQATERWGDSDSWIWVLHDDCAPEPQCLAALLTTAELAPSAGVLGPLALDWTDRRLVVEAGLSTDSSGHRQTGISAPTLDWRLLRGTDTPEVPKGEDPKGENPGRDDSARGTADDGKPVDSEPDGAAAESVKTAGDAADRADFERSTEVLAVSSAGMLIRAELWHELGGFDRGLPVFGEDIDFGWRANQAGSLVLCVPTARVRHARATSTGRRRPGALAGTNATALAASRAHGLRNFLVNCGRMSFVFGLPRLVVLLLLRAIGFGLVGNRDRAGAELYALRYLCSGRAWLRAGRQQRRVSSRPGTVSGLFVSRLTRLRNGIRNGVRILVRRNLERGDELGRLPEPAGASAVWTLPESEQGVVRRQVGTSALPAGALRGTAARGTGIGLRRPNSQAITVSVPVAAQRARTAGAIELDEADTHTSGVDGAVPDRAVPDRAGTDRAGTDSPGTDRPGTDAESSGGPDHQVRRPTPGVQSPSSDLVFVELGARRVLAATLFSPPVLMFLGLTVIAVLANLDRLGMDLVGGRVLPVGGLSEVWSQYLAGWHSVAGGTSANAPVSLAVLGVLGAVFAPVGGPATALAVLMLFAAPLAGLAAYAAARRVLANRWIRALAAAAYALLPTATAAVAQGRPDVVFAHLLLPLVLAGVAAVLRPRRSAAWLSNAVLCAAGLALLGAFSPLIYVVLVVGILLGFVVVPAPAEHAGRRIAGLCIAVLLPIVLLLPWPVALLSDPGLVLHGPGAYQPETGQSVFDLLSLHPGGAGSWQGIGLVVLLAAVAALVLRPTRAALPALGLVLLGALALAVLVLVAVPPVVGGDSAYGWTGPALLLISTGLLWTVVASCRPGVAQRRITPSLPRIAMALAGLAVVGLAANTVIAGSGGALRGDGGYTLAEPLRAELAESGRSVLVLPADEEPVRQVAARLPAFGDDDLAPAGGSAQRLRELDAGLRGTDEQAARNAVAFAAASGVSYVVLPTEADAARLRAVTGELTADAPATSDGRGVVRLLPVSGNAVLISPELAQRAVRGGAPSMETSGTAVAPVDAEPPDVAVRTSDGAGGRLLVLAAAEEPGWRASVDGEEAPIVRAWGNQVAVEVPTRGAEVHVELPSALRAVFLLAQAAAVLFTVLTMVPSRRRTPARP